jgi:hypothetical protein
MHSRTGFVPMVFGLLVPGLAFAHHSLALYAPDTTQLEGEVVDIAWQNPHVTLRLRTTGTDGKLETWLMEGGSVTTLQRAGVTRELLRVGDRVKVAGRASRSEPFVMGVTNVLLPDGREAQLLTGAPGYFKTSGDRLIRGADRVVADAARENRGVFRVWSVPSPNTVGAAKLQALPFTAAAVAARKSFDLLDNFATRCEPEGMPRLMFSPHPFEFVDRGSTIALRAELYDTERTIHMDRAMPPAGEPTSRLGYSVGRWDGKELVVTTTRVSWPFFDNIGSPQTTAVEIAERFRVSDDQTKLTFHVTVTDPATFTAPAVVEGYWLALGDTIARYDCQTQPRK